MFNYDHIYKSFRSGKLEPFYENLYPGLLVYASRQLGDELSYLAEDCVQDAVMDSFNERHRLGNSMAWYSYMLKSIFHSSVSLVRKNNSRNNYLDSGVVEQASPDLDVAILEQEALDMLYQAIETLPQKYRVILRMSFVEGLRNGKKAESPDAGNAARQAAITPSHYIFLTIKLLHLYAIIICDMVEHRCLNIS